MENSNLVEGNQRPETLWRLVDSKCEQLKDAIHNARIAFFACLLCGFIWFAALYNHEYGYINKLLNRYEIAIISARNSNLPKKAFENSWAGRYHHDMMLKIDSSKVSKAKLDTLFQIILKMQHEKFLQDQIDFWKVGVPGISSQVFIFDMGVIGQLGLLILLIWFFYATRREKYAVRSFVDINDDSLKRKWFPEKFMIIPQQPLFLAEHYSYAYQAVAHRFMFLLSTISKPLLGVTIILILFPCMVSFWNCYTDIRDLIILSDKIEKDSIFRAIAGTILLIGVLMTTYGAMHNSVRTSVLLNGWYLANLNCWEPAWAKGINESALSINVSRKNQTAEFVSN